MIQWKTVFSTDSVRIIGHIYAKKKKGGPWPKPHTLYDNSKWIINLSVKCKTIRLLEENIEEYLHELGLGKELLKMTPKV